MSEVFPLESVTIRCRPKAWIMTPARGDRLPWTAFLRGRDPSECPWPLQGRFVLIEACGEARDSVNILAIEVLRAGARSVLVHYSNGKVIEYDPSARVRFVS